MKRRTSDENSILERIQARFADLTKSAAGRSLLLEMGDDAALFRPKVGFETILTCDWFLEGTHFLRAKHPPDSVGWKCLVRALSDVAAMGGVPRCFLLSLALPESHAGRWLDALLGGLRRASRKFACTLAGGDTTRRREILINVTIVGEVRNARAILRSGARAGDRIYVTGHVGEAELGLRILRRSKRQVRPSNPFLKKHLYPEPRLALGQWLAEKGLATAMMDLSDGLSSDLPRLCAASGVGARVEIAKLPVVQVPGADRKPGVDPLQLALHGGDDYELLFTVSPEKSRVLPRTFGGVGLTPIGRITEKQELIVLEENSRERHLVAGGWDPFRNDR
jgi:thiamine-monophosphate kinase